LIHFYKRNSIKLANWHKAIKNYLVAGI